MRRIGRALAVVARDVRDDRALVGREPHDVGVLDQVVAVLVVAVVADVVADVVEQRGRAEEQALALAEAVVRRPCRRRATSRATRRARRAPDRSRNACRGGCTPSTTVRASDSLSQRLKYLSTSSSRMPSLRPTPGATIAGALKSSATRRKIDAAVTIVSARSGRSPKRRRAADPASCAKSLPRSVFIDADVDRARIAGVAALDRAELGERVDAAAGADDDLERHLLQRAARPRRARDRRLRRAASAVRDRRPSRRGGTSRGGAPCRSGARSPRRSCPCRGR